MDDCNLDKLSVKPGKLSPAFNRDITDYNVTVGSNVDKITFDCLTRDTGASYCISGSDGGRTVPLKEGEVNDIKIEVTAEDGTVKNYFVHVHRLSAKDATLSGIKISKGKLKPDFSPSTLEYSVLVPCDVSSITVTPTTPDPKVAVTVDDEKSGTEVKLNVSQTIIIIKVTSVDGSNTQMYKLFVYRKQIPRYVKLVDSTLAMKYECPVSLAPFYQPITIKDSEPKHTYSGPIIDHFTKTSKIDPLSELPIPSDWRLEDIECDKDMSAADACIPLTGGGFTEKVKLSELGALLSTCNKKPQLEELKVKYGTDVPVKHNREARSWEKQLQQIFDENNPSKLCSSGDSSLKKYYDSLPRPGTTPVYMMGESPLDHLEHAIHCYATAIKYKPNDAALHLRLALLLEERYYVQDLYGVKKAGDSDKVDCNVEAKESSKAEECMAICQLHGVDAGAPLSLQLKAIEEEYHQLKQSSQSAKADHVQALFAWKSKQATQEGAAAQKASDEESPLGQAYLKCMDALSLDESKAVYHFHVGRLLVIRGDFDEAVTRLEAALGWNENHQLSKFYLGFALTLKKNGAEKRAKEAAVYLLETMETLLEQQTKEALSEGDSARREVLHAEDLLRTSNVHLLRGFIQLGKLLEKNKDMKNTMSPTDIYHTAALLSSHLLPVVHKGDTYQQIEWVLLDAHSLLLEHLLSTQSDNVNQIANRCQRLSALIKYSTIPQNNDILALQQKTCQNLVQIQPCSSRALYLLGNSQLTQYDNDPQAAESANLLTDAKLSFKASISLEGKPAVGEPPEQLTEQKWWLIKKQEEEQKKKAEEAAKAAPAGNKATPGGAKGPPAGRGGTPARGAPARGGAATRGATKAAAAPSGRGGGKGPAAPAARGGAASRGTKGGPVPKTVQDKAKASGSSSRENVPTKSPESDKKPTSASQRPPSANKQPPAATTAEAESKTNLTATQAAPINKKSYHPRLGLARALSKNKDNLNEALKYYKEVMDLAPELHDAYVESAEMIVKTDPMAAVDIYSRFPVSDTLSFDDAFIFGEIVRLLMKAEKYDDPRLGPNMIKLGKVLGLASLEKYVEILENKYKNELLKTIYAGVNGKDVDDPDMQAFFKFKLWA